MEDLTDNEHEEQLRRWWSENWLWIVGGIALGLALLWGWQYWQRSKVAAAQREEAAYAAVLDSLGKNQFDQAALQAKALRDDRATSPYADQADLALARAADRVAQARRRGAATQGGRGRLEGPWSCAPSRGRVSRAC